VRQLLVVVAFFLTLTGRTVAGEDYPSRLIKLVVPLAAGSGTDAVARIVAAELAETLRVTIVVENKVGANGTIGSASVARAAPDGYTLLIGGTTTHAANSSLMKQVPYNPVTDFTPVSQLGVYPYALMVAAGSTATSFKTLVDQSKAKPATMTIAYGNALGQLMAELLRRRGGLDAALVPYKGSPQAMTDIIGGRVDAIFNDLPPAVSHLQAGSLRALAVSTDGRTALLPEIPTLAEVGFDGPRVEAWNGVFGPPGLPPAIVDKLSASLQQVMAKPELKAKLALIGFEAKPTSPAMFGKRVAAEMKLWSELTKEVGLEPQ
jgi:tripartite-type tricarboxylate transporter receptor subunit TctC